MRMVIAAIGHTWLLQSRRPYCPVRARSPFINYSITNVTRRAGERVCTQIRAYLPHTNAQYPIRFDESQIEIDINAALMPVGGWVLAVFYGPGGAAETLSDTRTRRHIHMASVRRRTVSSTRPTKRVCV